MLPKLGLIHSFQVDLSTGDLTSGERGRQLIGLNTAYMLYDFG